MEYKIVLDKYGMRYVLDALEFFVDDENETIRAEVREYATIYNLIDNIRKQLVVTETEKKSTVLKESQKLIKKTELEIKNILNDLPRD